MGVPDGTGSTWSCLAVGSGSRKPVTVSSGCSMSFLARVSGEPGGDDTGGDHDNERYGDEGERRAPGTALRAGIRLLRVREDLQGQRGVRSAEHVRVDNGRAAQDREDQRRRLARGSGDG